MEYLNLLIQKTPIKERIFCPSQNYVTFINGLLEFDQLCQERIFISLWGFICSSATAATCCFHLSYANSNSMKLLEVTSHQKSTYDIETEVDDYSSLFQHSSSVLLQCDA